MLATILLSSKKARTGNGCKLIPWNCLHQSVFLAPKWLALFLPIPLAVGFMLNTFAHSPFRLAWTRTYDAWCLFCTRVNANQPIIRQAPELQVLTRWATLWKVDNLHGSSLLRDHGTRRNSLNPRFFFYIFPGPAGRRRLRHFGCPGLIFRTKTRQAGETEMRYAPAGYKFSIPLNDILMAKGLDLSWDFTSPCPNCPWFRVDEIQCDYAIWAWHLMVGYTDDLRRNDLAGIQVDTFRPRMDQRLLIGSCQFGLARQTVPWLPKKLVKFA